MMAAATLKSNGKFPWSGDRESPMAVRETYPQVDLLKSQAAWNFPFAE
jgi:hypothetical protein